MLGPCTNPLSLSLRFRVSPTSSTQELCPRWSFELPRFSHPSARPVLKPWVAPWLCYPGRASRCGCELPRTLHLQALPAMDPRVASHLSSFSAAGIESTGCPDVFALPVAPADVSSGFPRQLHLPALPATNSASRPASLVLRRCWRWRLRVAPRPRIPAAPPGVAAGFPVLCTFRLCLGFEFPGRPEFPLPWRRLMVPRVASVSAPSGLAVPASSGFPESCIYGLGR